MTMHERIADIAQRLAREFSQARAQVDADRRRLSGELEGERQRLADELHQRNLQLADENGSLGRERARVHVLTSDVDDEVLTLNVGGHLFSTRRSTLCAYEGSYLANLFSGRWETSIERDGEGRYFLDFDPLSFRLVLNFLRSKRLEHKDIPVPPPVVAPERDEHFHNLVEYLGLGAQLQESIAAAKAREGDSRGTAASSTNPLSSSFLLSAGAFIDALRAGAPAAEAAAAASAAATAAAPVPLASPATAPTVSSPAPMQSVNLRGPTNRAVVVTEGVESASSLVGLMRGRDAAQGRPVQASGQPSSISSSAETTQRAAAVGSNDVIASGVTAEGSVEEQPSCARRPGWSRKVAHRLTEVDEKDGCIVNIRDTRALAAAAAVRATRGFRSGTHSWKVTVDSCSDWSYVGFVGETWASTAHPVGRASCSWGVASGGAAFQCRENLGELQEYSAGSHITFVIKMDERLASVVIDGTKYHDIFDSLPDVVYPAVSNCRSAARYSLQFLEDMSDGPLGAQ